MTTECSFLREFRSRLVKIASITPLYIAIFNVDGGLIPNFLYGPNYLTSRVSEYFPITQNKRTYIFHMDMILLKIDCLLTTTLLVMIYPGSV